MNADEVVAVASQLTDALGPEPDDATERAAATWNEDEGRDKTPDELEATEMQRQVVDEWRRLEDNATLFLCEAADWDHELLLAAEHFAPPGRWDSDDVHPADKWWLISWARMTAWRATADPHEPKVDRLGHGSTVAEELAMHFARRVYLALGVNPSAWRPCDRAGALAVWDRVLAAGPRDSIDGHAVTDAEAEHARLALLVFEATGRDERRAQR